MGIEIKREPDPDFPARQLYRIDCPKCGKFFIGTTENFVKNNYSNHRQVHNGEQRE